MALNGINFVLFIENFTKNLEFWRGSSSFYTLNPVQKKYISPIPIYILDYDLLFIDLFVFLDFQTIICNFFVIQIYLEVSSFLTTLLQKP